MMVDSEFLSTFRSTGKPRPDERLILRARTQGKSESQTFRTRTGKAGGEETRPNSDVLTTEGKRYSEILKELQYSSSGAGISSGASVLAHDTSATATTVLTHNDRPVSYLGRFSAAANEATRQLPVADAATAAICSGVPTATISPPPSPPPGPRSIT